MIYMYAIKDREGRYLNFSNYGFMENGELKTQHLGTRLQVNYRLKQFKKRKEKVELIRFKLEVDQTFDI